MRNKQLLLWDFKGYCALACISLPIGLYRFLVNIKNIVTGKPFRLGKPLYVACAGAYSAESVYSGDYGLMPKEIHDKILNDHLFAANSMSSFRWLSRESQKQPNGFIGWRELRRNTDSNGAGSFVVVPVLKVS